MKPTVDIIEDLVTGFNPSSKIKTVVDNLNGTFTITVCNTLNIRAGSNFKINATSYVAVSVDTNLKTITYTSGVAPTTNDLVYGSVPFYWHGTPIATGNELQRLLKEGDKMPMVYLLEIITDDRDNDPDSTIDRLSTVRLFFLDGANFGDWDTDQHYSEAVVPMANWAEVFMQYLDSTAGIGVINNYSMTYHAKFGLNIRVNQGHIQNLFPENVSGVEVRVTLPILKTLTCSC